MRRIFVSILALLIIVGAFPLVGYAANELFITSTKTFNMEAGKSLKIPLTIKNASSKYIDNISVTAEISDPGLVYITGSAYDSIRSLDSNESDRVNFNVTADERAKDGSYRMDIEMKYELYEDIYNEETGQWEYKTTNQTSTDTVYIRVTSVETAPQLTISRVDIMPSNTISPGDNVAVGFELENKGDGPARDIKVSLNGLSGDGFTLHTGLNNKTVQLIERGKKSYVYFELKSSRRMKAGSYDLEMNLSYKDDKGTEIKDSNKFFINVESNANRSSNLVIQDLSYPTGSIGQNQEVTVLFKLKNQGQTDAKNIVVKADSLDQSGLVPKSVSLVRIPAIAPGATETVTFKFLTTKTGETKNYPIDINIEYEDDLISSGEKYSLNQFIGIFAVAPGEEVRSTPKLIIDKYNFEPTLVKAGETFKMNLSFFNTNSEKTVRNIKIFLTSDERTDPNSPSAGGSVFTPVDSSNTFYIDSIPPKGRVEKTITMFTVPDALAKTYTLTANFEYEDNKGEQYTAIELIGVPVVQVSKLDTGELNYMPEAFVGQSTPISLEFYNTGKVTLYNMMVKIEGDFQTENAQYYVGNFTSGSSEYFEGYVIPNAPGEIKGDVVFTYEDSTGQEQEIRKEFTLNVMDMPPMPEYPGEEFPPFEEPRSGGISKIGTFIGIFIAIVIAIVAIVVVKKRKRKLEEMAIDE